MVITGGPLFSEKVSVTNLGDRQHGCVLLRAQTRNFTNSFSALIILSLSWQFTPEEAVCKPVRLDTKNKKRGIRGGEQ